MLSFRGKKYLQGLSWQGDAAKVATHEEDVRRLLLEFDQALWVVEQGGVPGLVSSEAIPLQGKGMDMLAVLPALPLDGFGDPYFKRTYGTQYAYYAGAMANGISSEE